MLRKENRLSRITKNKKGKEFENPLFKLRVFEAESSNPRFAFVVSKKISKSAVVRNRTKRVLRKAVEELLEIIKSTKDTIVIAKKELAFDQKEEAKNNLINAFKQAKIL